MGWDGDAPERHERDPAGVRGPGPDLAVVHHRVRPLGREASSTGSSTSSSSRDGRWLTVAWVVDLDTGKTLATPYAISHDQGATWNRGLTGFLAQTTKTIELPDGRILAVYRRNDEPGLWATTARVDGDVWINEETVALWRGQSSGMTGDTNPGEELAQLKFGFPQMVLEPDGAVFLVFWCEEDCIKNIRWLRLAVLIRRQLTAPTAAQV